MNTQRIDLDLSKVPMTTPIVYIGQGDSSGTTIVAGIYDNGQAATLTGMSARFCMLLPNGEYYARDTDCTVSGSTITYVVDESHFAAIAGITDDAYFEILDGDTVMYSTQRFRVNVLQCAYDGHELAADWDSAVTNAVDACTSAASSANSAASLANTKAELADTKAELANTKAELADQKATAANEAATNANNKATLANEAATNANDKATAANNAASSANNAASAASSAAADARAAITMHFAYDTVGDIDYLSFIEEDD